MSEEHSECPLCMEALEMDDLNFFPCTCGYQICRFCWHRIRTDENGLCPACRKQYPEDPAGFTPLTSDELAKIKSEKRQKESQRKQKLSENRKHLANVRVVQRNLVFVVGLAQRLADPEALKKHEYFGKFGKIHKVVINHSTSYAGSQGPSASAYVTYHRAEDALRAIQAVNNIVVDGRTLKASLGTTKYCSHFLKGQQCPKSDCMYLHELGDEAASFTKEEMQQGKHQDYEKKLHEQLFGTSQNPVEKSKEPTRKQAASPTPPQQLPNANSKDAWPSLGSNSSNPVPSTSKSDIRHGKSQISQIGPHKPDSNTNGNKSNILEQEDLRRSKEKSSPETCTQSHSSHSYHTQANVGDPPQLSLGQTKPSLNHAHSLAPNLQQMPNSSHESLFGGVGGSHHIHGSQSSPTSVHSQMNNSSGGGGGGPFGGSGSSSASSSPGSLLSASAPQHAPVNYMQQHHVGHLPNRGGFFNSQADNSHSFFSIGNGFPSRNNKGSSATDWTCSPDPLSEVNHGHISSDWQTQYGFDSPQNKDDDLGFDPWDESSKALRDLIEKESMNGVNSRSVYHPTKDGLGSNSSGFPINRFSSGLNHISDYCQNQGVPSRRLGAPPGFTNHINSFNRNIPRPPLVSGHQNAVSNGPNSLFSDSMMPNTSYNNHIKEVPLNNSKHDSLIMKDWQDSLRTMFPTINFSIGSQNISSQHTLAHHAANQQKPWSPGFPSSSSTDMSWMAQDPAIVSSGNPTESRSDSPPHWMKSLHQLTEVEPPVTYNSRLPFAAQFAYRPTTSAWSSSSLPNAPPGFCAPLRPADLRKVAENL